MYWVVSPGRAASGQWPVSLPRGTFVVTSWCSHLQSSRALLRFSHLAEQRQGVQYQLRTRPKPPSQSSFILQTSAQSAGAAQRAQRAQPRRAAKGGKFKKKIKKKIATASFRDVEYSLFPRPNRSASLVRQESRRWLPFNSSGCLLARALCLCSSHAIDYIHAYEPTSQITFGPQSRSTAAKHPRDGRGSR